MAYSARIDELEKKFSENARRYFAPLANEYRKAGDLDRAIEICRAHLPQQPGHMSGHIVYGQALYESRQLDEAKTVFEAALALDPENLIALRHLGDIARDSMDPATARTWYLRVLDADPRNDEVAAMLAELDAQTQPAPAEAPPPDAGTTGWGDINPERGADDPVTGESVEAEAGGDEAGEVEREESDSMHAESVDASRVADEIEPIDVTDLRLEPMPGDGADDDALTPGLASGATPKAGADAAPMKAPAPASLDRMLNDAFAPEADDALADVDGLFAGLSPAATSSSAADAPASEPLSITGDSMFGDADADETAPGDTNAEPVLGLETREFVPPRPPIATTRKTRDTGSMAVAGLTSFEQPTDEDSSTRAAFVTETMAELYLQQGFTEEALDIYRQLLEQNPEDSNLRDRIAQLEQGGGSSLSIAAVSSEVIEAAQQRHAAKKVRTVRAFFGQLAGHYIRARDESDDDHEPTDGDREGPNAGEAPTSFSSLQAESERPAAPSRPTPPASRPRAATPPAGATNALVSDLFGDAEISAQDESAASMLASAFSSLGANDPRVAPEPRAQGSAASAPGAGGGRAAHTAGRELSLDQVFRDPGTRNTRKSGAYSFDQFFSDGTSAPPASGAGDAEQSRGAESDESDGDLEQFTAWLEGLKRK